MAEYIEREAATTLFARACGECKEACEEFDGFYPDCNQCLLHGVLKEFASIPAADVREVVRGKWIYNEAYVLGNPYGSYRCTACSQAQAHKSNYCPTCGADMRECDT